MILNLYFFIYLSTLTGKQSPSGGVQSHILSLQPTIQAIIMIQMNTNNYFVVVTFISSFICLYKEILYFFYFQSLSSCFGGVCQPHSTVSSSSQAKGTKKRGRKLI